MTAHRARRRRGWIIALAVVVTLAVGVTVLVVVRHDRDAREAREAGPRRRMANPIAMLYPGMFAGIPEFESPELQSPAGPDPSGYKNYYSKAWYSERSAGDDFLIIEMVEVHSSPVAAASFYRSDDPRYSALDEVVDASDVGPDSSYKANGSPNTSRVFRGILAGDYDAQGHLTQSCESWYWWARYGQYTVELYTMISLDDEIVYFDNFSKAVDVVSARIAACLATGC